MVVHTTLRGGTPTVMEIDDDSIVQVRSLENGDVINVDMNITNGMLSLTAAVDVSVKVIIK